MKGSEETPPMSTIDQRHVLPPANAAVDEAERSSREEIEKSAEQETMLIIPQDEILQRAQERFKESGGRVSQDQETYGGEVEPQQGNQKDPERAIENPD